MRNASLAVFLLLSAGCQFDGSGLGTGDGAPGSGGAGDAAVADASSADAARLDAALPDAAPPDAGGEPDARVAPCGSATEYVEWPDNGHFYRLVDSSSSWDAARTTCAGDDAHLAIIDDQAENDHVRGLTSSGNLWIGLNDQDMERTFVWVDGTVLNEAEDFTNWNDGEPNNSFGEDCVEMRSDGQWNDRDCSSNRPFVCECDPDAGPAL